MKNREKYRDEILLTEWKNPGEFCDEFIKPKILEPKGRKCDGINCSQCNLVQIMWLDEEYVEPEEPKEPEIDWSKVAVDTPILASENGLNWFRRYFARYEDNKVFAWDNGCDSWSATYREAIVSWKYAKLAEVE